MRTCVGCRSRDERSALVRVVLEGGDVVPDPERRRPGRGAWLHPTAECLDKAISRRAFGRALRATSPVDASRLQAWVSTLHPGPAPAGPDGIPESGFDADEHPMSTQR
ncbi:YlxR family protein [Calidifontibacter sp. DB0510]|uniref:YlxR family protein n=1 Tax=Metallococcus carri TaxID=1656884 RepID=A0A967AXJ2_9MICO|nr:YlxR family protein [Metallococcus carri]NHN54277.1 YlxR family protein [Metallococcus carri]NOP36883.1 DUF448 domain-containing protein [Calidifontibacter sp. DB2511S]